jgi:N-acetylmuramate 1-kinase
LSERDALITAFLSAHAWPREARAPLAGDASFRRYERLTDGKRRAVLMDAPPPQEDVRPFVALASHLRQLGLSAPEILAQDTEAGLLLIEDLGDDTYTRLLAGGSDEESLYALAVDVLAAIHRLGDGAIPAGLPAYDDQSLLDEARLLTDWYLPAATGRPTDDGTRREYENAWLSVTPLVQAQPPTLVLRDYHVDNLMKLPGRAGVAACGLLDFQDAVAGPAAYDLMSLLEDARRNIDEALIAAMMERYFSAFPGLDRQTFETAFAILGAQRHAKIIGIFARLCIRDAKPDYLVHIPRVWRLLERSLRHPALTVVRDWFDHHVAKDIRGIPPC